MTPQAISFSDNVAKVGVMSEKYPSTAARNVIVTSISLPNCFDGRQTACKVPCRVFRVKIMLSPFCIADAG